MLSSTETKPPSVLLSNCIVCGLALPLRLPGPGEVGEEWVCNGCTAEFTAIFVHDCSHELRANVRRKSERSTEDILHRVLASQGTLRHVPSRPKGIRSRLQTELSLGMDELIDDHTRLVIPPQGEALAKRCKDRGTDPYDEDLAKEIVNSNVVQVKRIGASFRLLAEGHRPNIRDILSILNEIIEQSLDDSDIMICLGINPDATDYPSRHSVHSAIVAMSIGMTMGLDERTVSELGLGCILHDAGMMAVADQFTSSRPFKIENQMEIATHPLHTLEMIKRDFDDIPEASRMVVYQMHERCNGSGYPRGRTADAIHDLAKISMVADAFVALTSERFFRPAMTPYYAVLKILEEVRDGQFDPTVARGLLQTISLFPIGSYVSFGEGLLGKVIRKNTHKYDKPIVEVWTSDDRSRRPLIVDLATATDWPAPQPTVLSPK